MTIPNQAKMSSDIAIEIVDDITAEVLKGFELYARLTSRNVDQITNWAYWFKSNPYGRGIHALAMHRGKVVGLYSLVPTEMCLSGRVLLGAKAELLVVDTDYRSKYVKYSRMPQRFERSIHLCIDWMEVRHLQV